MSKQAGSQQRGNYRVEAHIKAQFLPIKDGMQMPVSNEVPVEQWISGQIEDLSVGGVRLTGPLQLEDKSMVALCFTPPSDFLDDMVCDQEIKEMSPFGMRLRTITHREPDFEELEICGKVIKIAVDSAKGKKNFQYHIEFVDLPTPIEDEILRYVVLRQRHALQMRNRHKN